MVHGRRSVRVGSRKILYAIALLPDIKQDADEGEKKNDENCRGIIGRPHDLDGNFRPLLHPTSYHFSREAEPGTAPQKEKDLVSPN